MANIEQSIHNDVFNKLIKLYDTKCIPHLLFYGYHGSGKSTLVNRFLDTIYETYSIKSKYILSVNCAKGTGISFVRNKIKLFAKNNLALNNKILFKTILLKNADHLTGDAQAALRRCIEIHSHTSRFIIIVENRRGLIKPILSRFCCIYIPYINRNGININLHYNNVDSIHTVEEKQITLWIKNNIPDIDIPDTDNIDIEKYIKFTDKMYNKGYSSLDLINYIKQTDIVNKNIIISYFNQLKQYCRCEKYLILLLLNYILVRSSLKIENIINI